MGPSRRWWEVFFIFVTATLVLSSLTFGDSQLVSAKVTPAAEWTMSGDGRRMIETVGFVQEGDRPLVVRPENVGADDYIITGEMLLSPDSSVALGFGTLKGEKRASSAAVRLGGGADPKLRVGRRYLTIPKASETWFGFSASVFHGDVTVHLAVPGSEPVQLPVPEDKRPLRLTLQKGSQVRNLKVKSFPSLSKLLRPVPIDAVANVKVTGADADPGLGVGLDPNTFPKGMMEVDGIPFCLVECTDADAVDIFKLKRTRRIRSRRASKEAHPNLVFQVPGGEYSAVHLIAFSIQRKGTVPRMTVRIGSVLRGGDTFVDETIDVPDLRKGQTKPSHVISRTPVKLTTGNQGFLYHLRVPLPKTGNLHGFDTLSVIFTRDISVKEGLYGFQRVDPPSSAVVLAATMERSPVTMQYSSVEPGNIFFDTQKVIFTLRLTNRSDREVTCAATVTSSGPGTFPQGSEGYGGSKIAQSEITSTKNFILSPHQERDVRFDVTPEHRGWYSCAIGVEVDGSPAQLRKTSFSVLAPDTRKAMGDSPFGVWCFWNGHKVTRDPDRVEKLASIIHKGGWRWTYGGKPYIGRKPPDGVPPGTFRYMKDKYKLTWNLQYPPYAKRGGPIRGAYYEEEKFDNEVVPWLKAAREKGLDPHYIVLHESRTSKAVVVRYSEFLGGEPYQMGEEERKKLEVQFEHAKKFCEAMRKADPDARIVLINDYPAYAAEYLKRGFPAELFDVLGSEGAMFARQPERQPDWLCLLGIIAQWKRIQAKYGYNKPVWFTEALYHGTSPGGLSLHEQAVISVREAMLALACGIERLAATGVVADSSDNYNKTGWGRSGYCFRDPEFNPKPSYPMYAWMTQVLDQAKYAGKVPHDSTALHILDFKKPNGSHVYPMWVVRGRQEVTLKITTRDATVYDAYGNELTAIVHGGELTIDATDRPVYITDTIIEKVVGRRPVEVKKDGGKVILEFDDSQEFETVPTESEISKNVDSTPQIKGRFKSSVVEVDGTKAMRVELLDDPDERKLLPRYVVFKLAEPVVLPGERPYALDIRVKGNGGWGRAMLECIDAKGKTWTSVGGGSMGRPYVNFDGWRTMRIYLPGQYPDPDQNMRWPRSRDWVSSGKNPVEYPIKLTKIIVAMRPHILYVDEEIPVTNRVIHLDRISVVDPPEGM